MLLGQLGFTVVCCIVVRFTVARTMPEDGTYHIGPRQLGSAGLLGVMFVFQFFALQTSLRIGLRPSAVVAPSLPSATRTGRSRRLALVTPAPVLPR